MRGFLEDFERLFSRQASEFEVGRWEKVLSEYDEEVVEMACAMHIESWSTADMWPTPEMIVQRIEELAEQVGVGVEDMLRWGPFEAGENYGCS